MGLNIVSETLSGAGVGSRPGQVTKACCFSSVTNADVACDYSSYPIYPFAFRTHTHRLGESQPLAHNLPADLRTNSCSLSQVKWSAATESAMGSGP